MKWGIARLIMHLKFRFHRKQVCDRELRLLVAGPMERGAPLVVDLVDVKVLVLRKVVQAEWLVTLSCNMEAVGTVDVRNVHIRTHLLDH